jgi:hypothetical protein
LLWEVRAEAVEGAAEVKSFYTQEKEEKQSKI